MNFLDNELKFYFGDDFVINNQITLHHPTIGDIVDQGEGDYFATVYTLSAIPSDMKSQLWDLGICWMDISDFEFFFLVSKGLPVEKTKVFFGDLDFTNFEMLQNPENGELIMAQPSPDGGACIIDQHIYLQLVTAIRHMHNITVKPEKASTETVKRILIEEDRRKLIQAKSKESKSQLLPMISSLVNCSEFKYGLQEVRNMPMYAFLDSLTRIQMIKNAAALLQGCYSGMIDTKKINKKELNWMRDIKEA